MILILASGLSISYWNAKQIARDSIPSELHVRFYGFNWSNLSWAFIGLPSAEFFVMARSQIEIGLLGNTMYNDFDKIESGEEDKSQSF